MLSIADMVSFFNADFREMALHNWSNRQIRQSRPTRRHRLRVHYRLLRGKIGPFWGRLEVKIEFYPTSRLSNSASRSATSDSDMSSG